jgi:predicted RNA binding protein YcfA (HicA-like mRNA interferase family)
VKLHALKGGASRQGSFVYIVPLDPGLEGRGFRGTFRSKGSHFRYKHPDGRKTTVPSHKGKDISRGLFRKILRDVDISIEELKKFL